MQIARLLITLTIALIACSCIAPPPTCPGLANPFFAIDTATKDSKHTSARAQVEMVKKLGYDGIAVGLPAAAEMLQVTDKLDTKLLGVYFTATIDPDKPSFHPVLPETINRLQGRDTTLWMMIESSHYRPSSTEGDKAAMKVVRQMADMAGQSGLKVAIYHHVDYYVETIEDAVRITRKANRENVGVAFNLYHWLKVQGPANMRSKLKLAKPHLYVVTINGSSNEGSIETLDRGEFNVYRLLKTLKCLGYTGPIGFQGYGIAGSARDNLERTMEAWRELCRRINLSQQPQV